MRLRLILFSLSLLAFLCALAGGYFYYTSLRQTLIDAAQQDAVVHVDATNNLISQYIADYVKMAGVLSALKEVQTALRTPENGSLSRCNELLESFQKGVSADVCYLMNRNGHTIASSNRFRPDSFVGKNYAFRPYFQEAIAGSSVVYLALGVTSGKRGIYFGHPVYVHEMSRPSGVAVIKASAGEIFERLSQKVNPGHTAQKSMLFIVDPNGVIFFSDEEQFLFQTLWQTTDLARRNIAETRQFGRGPWPWSGFARTEDETQVADRSGDRYMMIEEDIRNLPGWKIIHLGNLEAISSLAESPLLTTAGFVIIGLCVLIGGVIFFLNYLAYAEISKRRRIETSLVENEAKLRTIVEHSNELFYIHDTRHRLTYASPGSKDILGYTPEEMMVNWTQLATDNPINDKGVEITERAIRTGEKQPRYLLELRKKDGVAVLLEIDESPVKDERGNVLGISGAARDVTQKTMAEKALRESEERYRVLVEESFDGVLIQKGITIVFANERLHTMLGYGVGELPGKEQRMIFHPDFQDLIQKRGAARMQGETVPSHYEVKLSRKDGSWFYGEIGACAITLAGEPGIQVWIKDIHERKRMETQLRRAQKMEAIGTLAGGVAHDLNNILSGLVSYPELLLMQIPADSPLRKPILTIQKSGEKAAAVVQDLLTLARRGVTVTEVVNLNDIVSQYLQSPEYQRLTSFYPGVNLKYHLDPELMNILGSPVHLSKTVMNLVSNAAEAHMEGGHILISSENQYVDRPIKGYEDVVEGDYVVLSVSDTGTGIAPQDIKKIFEPFYTKKKMGRSGTGLGMAVVWGTVKDHHGYIDVESREGEGTTFRLFFPVTRKKGDRLKVSESEEEYGGHGESILVVDDVDQQREIASEMLEELGYHVASVSSGEAAVEYVKNHPVDLLVLDMIMDPGIDGLETYKRILEFRPGQKAIITSGFSESERVRETQRMGAGAYVKKPFLSHTIGPAIRAELHRKMNPE